MAPSLVVLLGETALKHVQVSVVGSLGMIRSYGNNPFCCFFVVIFLSQAISFLTDNLNTPRLFQKMGSDEDVYSLRITFETEHQIPSLSNVHAVTALLLLFLNALPVSFLSFR